MQPTASGALAGQSSQTEMVGVRGRVQKCSARPDGDGRQIRGKLTVWTLYADVERPVPHWHIRALSKQARAETHVFRDHVSRQGAGTHEAGEKI